MGEWTLFSNHGHVLVCLARNKRARLRDVASDVGITERAVQKIVSELQQAGLIAITKHGRCNQYEIHGKKNLRHPLEAGCTVGRLLQLVVKSQGEGGEQPAASHPPPKPERKQKPSAPQARPEAELPPAPPPEDNKLTKRAIETPPDKPVDKAPDKAAEKSSASKEDETRKQGSLF